MTFWVVYTAALVFVAVCFAAAAFAYFRPRRRPKTAPRSHVAVLDGCCAALVAQHLVAPKIALREARLLKPPSLDVRRLDEDAEFEAILDALATAEELTGVTVRRRARA